MYRPFSDEVRAFLAAAGPEQAEFSASLAQALDMFDELSAWLVERGRRDAREIGAASVEYLHLFGCTAYAWLWARMASVALARAGEESFYAGKRATARFYFARVLPRSMR